MSLNADQLLMNSSRMTGYHAALQLGTNLRETQGLARCPVIRSAETIAKVFSEMGRLEREVMVAGALDCKKRLIHWSIIAVGSNERLAMRIGDAFCGAVSQCASGIILIHNHPSGSLEPSADDFTLTRKVLQAGKLLGYPLFDHVIISWGGFHSLVYDPRLKKTSASRAPLEAAAERKSRPYRR